MKKIIKADFESIDKASFALSAIKAHCNNIKDIKLLYKKNTYDETPNAFSDFFTPENISTMPITQNGIIPQMFNGNVFREKHQFAEHAMEHKKAALEVTLNTDNAAPVISAIYQNGGYNLKEK